MTPFKLRKHLLNFIKQYVFGKHNFLLEIDKNVAVITGGCGGLGRCLATQLINRGIKTIVLDIALPPLSDRIPDVCYIRCDVTDFSQMQLAASEISARFGLVTILINNAGIVRSHSLLDMSENDIQLVLRVNLYASFITIKTFLPGMLTLGRGYIVTIASVLGHLAPARLSAYGASKAGLIAMHESLTAEIRTSYAPKSSGSRIRTLLVCPGQMQTAMFQGVCTPSSLFAPVLTPNNVAHRIVEMLFDGCEGTLFMPLYAHFIPLLRMMPARITEFARYLSGIDNAMNSLDECANHTSGSCASVLAG